MMDIPHPERLRRSRPWFKIWARHTLFGTTFSELDAAERGVWFSILCLACDSQVPGSIAVNYPPTIGYTLDQLAEIMNVKRDEVERSIKRLQDSGKIEVDSRGVIV